MIELDRSGFENPLIASGVVGLTTLYRSKTATPLEAAEAYLCRIECLNPLVNAFVFVDREGALQDAKDSTARWAADAPLSPLDGVPLGIKANIAVRGMPWHAGIAAYKERVADEDADCVDALRKGGAVILGVLNMHEAALGTTTDNVAFGRCHNPYRHDFTPGGSSGGSAVAVAAGLGAAALGTDTMGSVRIPASFCGVFGHMAQRGVISSTGVIPLSWSLDHMGVLARSARDIEAVLSVVGGNSRVEALGVENGLSRVAALDLSGQVELDTETARGFEKAIDTVRSTGIAVKRISLPNYDVVATRRRCLMISEVEGFVEHAATLAADPDGFSPDLSAMLHWAAAQSAPKVAAAYHELALTASLITMDLGSFDAILTPTTSTPAFSFAEPAPASLADFTLIANIADLAATAFPTGIGADSLPRSAQVLSRSDINSLQLARRLATACPAAELTRSQA